MRDEAEHQAEGAVLEFGARRCRDAEGVTDRRLRAAIALFALAGAAVAAYLVYTRYTHTQIACTTGGCETVLRSHYAKIGGVPIALFGAITYFIILCLQFVRSELAALAAAAISVAALVFALYLIVIQVAVLEALCQWCLTSDAVLVLLSACTVTRAVRLLRVTSAPSPAS